MNKKLIDPVRKSFKNVNDCFKMVCGEWQIIAFMIIYCNNSFGQMQKEIVCYVNRQ